MLDVAVTTGEVNDGDMIEAQVEAVQGIAGRGITTVTGDAGYAYGKVYAGLERHGVDPVIPAKRERKSRMPLRRFRYDARHDIVKCPQGTILRPQRLYTYGRFYYSKARLCKHCLIKDACLSKGRLNKGFAESAPIASAAEEAQNKRSARVTAAMNWMRRRFKQCATEERKRAATEAAALNCAGRMTRLYCLFTPKAPTILPSRPYSV